MRLVQTIPVQMIPVQTFLLRLRASQLRTAYEIHRDLRGRGDAAPFAVSVERPWKQTLAPRRAPA